MAKIATFYDHIVDISRQENMFVVDALKLARELGVEEELRDMGLEVISWGPPLTELLKARVPLLTV